jgi:3-phosphoshikimate 1-carboxyvinyltransferase
VSGGRALRGRVRTPGDKSISHRALLLGALAEGTTVIEGLSDGDDVLRTLGAVGALGALVGRDPGGAVTVTGGPARLHEPDGPLDCGNSGTAMRLLAGMVAGFPWDCTLTGDDSLSARPMDRVAEPLRTMGAGVEGRTPRCLPPLVVHGGDLHAITFEPPMASAQVKSAILLAGLSATGETVVREPVPTRAHTEEMLAAAGADVTVAAWNGGVEVRVRPRPLRPLRLDVPGDPSQAAFWIVAACLVPGSDVVVENVYAGRARTGFVGVLGRMGAAVVVRPAGGGVADLEARHAPLQGTEIHAAEIPSLDEVPVLAVGAAAARGTTVFRDMAELRVKEVDRLAAVAALVVSLGAGAEIVGDDLVVRGVGADGPLAHGTFDSGGDHRMAMAAVVGALAAGEGQSTVRGFDAVDTSYPGFVADLGRLTDPAAMPRRDPGAGPGSGRRVAPTPAAPGPRGPIGPDRTGLVIAIDGPAGSGKSSVSRTLAERLGVDRLDTGAMYRAVAWAALDRGVDPADPEGVAEIARRADIEVDAERVAIDGTDVTGAIRSPEVSRAVSAVAANPAVRREMVTRQRRWVAEHGGGVVEGRDIGTVVFPQAALKVFLDAAPEERARRRHDESPQGLARRDHLDTTRTASPLVVADGAHRLDTTGRTVEDVVEEVLGWL